MKSDHASWSKNLRQKVHNENGRDVIDTCSTNSTVVHGTSIGKDVSTLMRKAAPVASIDLDEPVRARS